MTTTGPRRTPILVALAVGVLALAVPAVPAVRAQGGPATVGTAPSDLDTRADAHFQQSEWAEAAGAYDELTRARPRDARLWYRLGYARHAMGDIAAAIPAHETAAKLGGPFTGPAAYNAACAHALQGHPGVACAWLERAVAAGFFAGPSGGQNRAQARADSDLESLRDDPRFVRLVGAPPAGPFVEPDVVVIHEWRGEGAGDNFGWEAKNVGDTDGDGVDDALVSAAFHGPQGTFQGKVYLYSGATGALRFARTGAPGEQLGKCIAGAGDVDADGVPDLAVGAPVLGAGRLLVLSGRDGAVLLDVAGESTGDLFGERVWGIGDWDGDGHDDVLVGAGGHDGLGADTGAVTLVSGADGSTLFSELGVTPGGRFGSAVGGLVDGDRRLLVIGAMGEGPQGTGRVHLDFGLPDRHDVVLQPEASAVHYGRFFVSVVGDVDGDGHADVYSSDFGDGIGGSSNGRFYVHSGLDGRRIATVAGRAGEGLGIGDARCGDVDGDGHADLLVGAWTAGDGAFQGGRVYLYSGADMTVLRTITGARPGEAFGFDATGLGDVDGDGNTDLLVTAAWSHGDAGAQVGRVYVISGAPAGG